MGEWKDIESAQDRLRAMSRVDPDTGCWNWIGMRKNGKRPYGRTYVGSRTDGTRKVVSAHRHSYEVFNGPIGDLHVCHRCDNPPCVNPDHLFLGTAKDNADDRDRKGRNSPAPVYRGASGTNAKLTDAQVAEIRASTESSAAIAPRYGVCDSHIRALRRGEHFKPSPPESKQ